MTWDDEFQINGLWRRQASRCEASTEVDLRMTELQTRGRAFVVSVDEPSDIEFGSGSVVTGRFVTRCASNLVRVTFDDGTQLTGTDNHPVWSPDEGDWRGLGDFQPGDLVQGRARLVVVERVERLDDVQPVYNLEVTSENVYELTWLGILVHNSGIECDRWLPLLRKNLNGKLTDPAEIAEFQKIRNQILNFRKYMDADDLAAIKRKRPGDHLHHILEKLGLSDKYRPKLLEAQQAL